MDDRNQRRLPSPFRPRTIDRTSSSNAQSNRKSSSSRALKEMTNANDRNSRSRASYNNSICPAIPPTGQKISSSRILNKDGSIPKSTDELITRGFEILTDNREKRRRVKEVQPRIASDSSSKSSTTYVGSPTHDSGPTNISQLPNSRPTVPLSSNNTATIASAPSNAQDVKRRLNASLESQQANIRAMQAEIAAVKRAAILTRELRNEASLEQSTKGGKGKDVERRSKTNKSVERRSIASEALMSGGNGTGDEEDIVITKQPRLDSNTHVCEESMEGLPTPPQLLPIQIRAEPRTTETRRQQRTQRKQEKRKSSRDKLCLCPNCISVTQQVVNTLVERYAMQNATNPTSPPENQPPLQNSPQKALQIDPKTAYRPCNTPPTTQSSATTPTTTSMTSHTPHQTQRSIPRISSTNRENQKPDSEDDYMKKLKEIRDTPCDCYDCRLMANQAEFERKNAFFPPIRNGVWARGRDSMGYWYW